MTPKAEIEIIINKIKASAKRNGYGLTNNLAHIARAKYAFFGSNKWTCCPYSPDDSRSCISKRCHEDIATNGTCHCKLYKRKDLQ